MATWTIKEVRRPRNYEPVAETWSDANYLDVKMVSDTHQQAQTSLYFADHAGLQTEWEAGTVITVLDAAIDAWIASFTETADDQNTSGQTSGKTGYTYTG